LNNVIYKKAVNDLKFVYSENNTLSIIFKDNNILMGVVGEFNNNLKDLEKITNTSIYSRGNSILVKSTPKKNELVKNAIVFLFDQFINNGTIEKKDIISSVNQFMIEERTDKIEYIIKTPKKSVIPRSEKQKKYVRALRDSEVIISSGPAGTGKTYLAVAVALTMQEIKK
jgi:Phosphate starvation-inducible protein PhoH, predicted ATPase